ncbi:fungal-specific transcription factor domain-containing protein [Cadophora sp. MPI-SDFR-AT-0126]|nr:fungal-specific transcription factor domain-containing protein [Leotiomycetes sp. MPI-SDFR-AT-0126]
MSSGATHTDSMSLGPQDCQKCKQRRIKCDRSLPNCKKCAKRHYSCPGYDAKLRWADAIAVRGRFKGKKFPPNDQTSGPSTIEKSKSKVSQRGRHYTTMDVTTKLPNDKTVAQLLYHYDHHIAGLMVWLDSENNAYRRLVLPLAERQPGLMLSILAISAKHLSASGDEDSNFSRSACDAAVVAIANTVQEVTNRLAEGHDFGSESDMETAEWMLASMLTLSGYEMMGSNSLNWQAHRQAARTLVNALGTPNRRDNELYTFLRNQLSILDVLACTTSFKSDIENGVILPEVTGKEAIFGEFLAVLHSVTIESRMVLNPAIPVSAPTTSSIQHASQSLLDKLEMARGSTLMAAGSLNFDTKWRERDFIRLVDAYHHAGLLHSYRTLHLAESNSLSVQYSIKRLTELLDGFEKSLAWVQNFPWPVFILGTESHGDISRQAIVRSDYKLIIEKMGSGHFVTVLQFLEDFWASENPDWAVRAREWEARGIQILAV